MDHASRVLGSLRGLCAGQSAGAVTGPLRRGEIVNHQVAERPLVTVPEGLRFLALDVLDGMLEGHRGASVDWAARSVRGVLSSALDEDTRAQDWRRSGFRSWDPLTTAPVYGLLFHPDQAAYYAAEHSRMSAVSTAKTRSRVAAVAAVTASLVRGEDVGLALDRGLGLLRTANGHVAAMYSRARRLADRILDSDVAVDVLETWVDEEAVLPAAVFCFLWAGSRGFDAMLSFATRSSGRSEAIGSLAGCFFGTLCPDAIRPAWNGHFDVDRLKSRVLAVCRWSDVESGDTCPNCTESALVSLGRDAVCRVCAYSESR